MVGNNPISNLCGYVGIPISVAVYKTGIDIVTPLDTSQRLRNIKNMIPLLINMSLLVMVNIYISEIIANLKAHTGRLEG